ncbi:MULTISPECIES: winged helix-turn-helix domain-containing protein [Aeromonas]|uniref:winged helix-turn-helix domain-containing protein n=1 Tax=Aeromonas TaxID=642 RepID=UPI00051AC5AB|nr:MULTISPECIES: winged helix-turn-helix domain-containing protein [Aeromonas]MCH7372180.1 winged helix-turn-helix domain-containing protein [Aeromonas sp. MR16]
MHEFEMIKERKERAAATYLVNKDKSIVVDLMNGTFTFLYFAGTQQSQIIRMGSREASVLRYLVSNSGYLVSKDEILNSVWHGRIVCENTVSVALSNIRKLLRRVDQDCRCLVTVARAGYIFYPYRSGFTVEDSHD